MAKRKSAVTEVEVEDVIAEPEAESSEETQDDGKLQPFSRAESLWSDMIAIDQISGWEGGDPAPEGLVESIRVLGQIEPVVLREYQNGAKPGKPFIVVAGTRRIKALDALGETYVQAKIESRDDADDLMMALAENFQRSENVIGNAALVGQLMDQGYSDKDISQLPLGMNIAKVRQMRDVHYKLDERIKQGARDGIVAPWSCWHIARQPQEIQDKLVALMREKGKITKADVEHVRREKVASATAEAIPDRVFDISNLSGFGAADDDIDPSIQAFEDATEGVTPGEVGVEAEQQAAENKRPVKMSRQDRRNVVLNYLRVAKKEMVAIKAPRTDDEKDVLTFLDEAIGRLEDMAAESPA